VRAEMGVEYCYYEGEPYSEGACVRSVCTAPAAQKCQPGGTWSGCIGC
jgi:hypothetical protein